LRDDRDDVHRPTDLDPAGDARTDKADVLAKLDVAAVTPGVGAVNLNRALTAASVPLQPPSCTVPSTTGHEEA
jgi:hypothetical protein